MFVRLASSSSSSSSLIAIAQDDFLRLGLWVHRQRQLRKHMDSNDTETKGPRLLPAQVRCWCGPAGGRSGRWGACRLAGWPGLLACLRYPRCHFFSALVLVAVVVVVVVVVMVMTTTTTATAPVVLWRASSFFSLQIRALDAVGFQWSGMRKSAWEQKFAMLTRFVKLNGTSRVVAEHKDFPGECVIKSNASCYYC